MRVVWVLSAGFFVAWAASCSDSEKRANGDGSGGSSAGESGAGGAPVGGGGTATGGSDAGAAGSGTGGASACECEGDPDVPDPEVSCTLPLQLFCLEDDPLDCATTLSDALSDLGQHCDPGYEGGALSQCPDGTTELTWVESGLDSSHRLVFDTDERLIGRYFFGAAYSRLHSNVCLERGDFDFYEYEAGFLPDRTCEQTCDICSTGEGGVGGASQDCLAASG
jgi:hypothetical protein